MKLLLLLLFIGLVVLAYLIVFKDVPFGLSFIGDIAMGVLG